MDGCGRLRTVADDCEQLRTVRRRGANTPSTPRPPVKGEPLLRIRGKSLYTEELLHTEAGTQRNFYAQKLLSAQRSFYTEAFTHTEAVTQRNFTQRLLHTKVFHTKNLYTEELLHTEVFTHRRVYTQYLFSQRSFYVEKSLHIFHDVSCFIIIHHLSFSYFSSSRSFSQLPPALLSGHAGCLVFVSHGVLSVHASSLLPLRRSKLNENPGINSD